MAKAIPQEDVKEYGQQVVEEQNAEALAAGAQGAQADNPIIDIAQAPATAPQPAPQPAAPGRAQPTNLLQLVPPDLLFRQKNRNRPSSVVRYDVGRLWAALADDPNVPSLTRLIAERLKGEI